MKKLFAAVFALVLSSAAAQAATIDFDFTGNGGLATSYSFTDAGSGVSVTATAASFNNSGTVTTNSNYRVGQYSLGLGMTRHWSDSHQVDGGAGNDLIVFDFNRKITIESVSFTHVDSNDQFSFFFDGTGSGLSIEGTNFDIDITPGTWSWGIGSDGTHTFDETWTGTLFGIGAHDPHWQDWSRDDFKISGMSVSVVPLPAALPLYGAGMAVLGFIGWRRKKRLAA